MKQTDLKLAMVNLGRSDGGMPAELAMHYLVSFAGRLDPKSSTFDVDVRMLIGIGARIWALEYPLLVGE